MKKTSMGESKGLVLQEISGSTRGKRKERE
jgi:hypothetical protein